MDKKVNTASTFISDLKESVSNPINHSSVTRLRRNKKLRRQTATLDVSYATDFGNLLPSRPNLISTSGSEIESASVEEQTPEIEDDWSETISDAFESCSLESFDRLSCLSDSVPEYLDSDQMSKLSVPLLLFSGSDPSLNVCSIEAEFRGSYHTQMSDCSFQGTSSTSRFGDIDIVIERVVPQKDFVVKEKRKSDTMEGVEGSNCDKAPSDVPEMNILGTAADTDQEVPFPIQAKESHASGDDSTGININFESTEIDTFASEVTQQLADNCDEEEPLESTIVVDDDNEEDLDETTCDDESEVGSRPHGGETGVGSRPLPFPDEDPSSSEVEPSSQTTRTKKVSVPQTFSLIDESKDISREIASAPVTPMADEKKKKKKKSKNSSPALSLLEKSTSWLSSLSPSASSKKEKKKSSTNLQSKRSLTSIFGASSDKNNSTGNMSQQDGTSQTILKHPMSNTLPSAFGDRLHRRSTVPEKIFSLKRPSHDSLCLSSSSLSLTDIELTAQSQTNLSPVRKHKNEKLSQLSPSIHPSGYYTIDSRHSRRSLIDKKLLLGIKQFNLDPKKGLDSLGKMNFLDTSNPEEVASFLFREGRLSKKQIGAFIGDHHDFNKLVLNAFVARHEFMNLILVQALRTFLWSFRLPGEAMQIDRIMEAFALHYCDQNPNLFDEPDTCYIISFSIIMLNTALHNPNVRQKITLEQFISQNRGINSGKDLPKDILELIYRNIKDEPFKIPNENYDDLMYTFFSPEKEGWLLKRGGNWKSWKRRWFLLSDRCLYYFQHTAENVPKGIIPLENVKVRVVDDKDGRNFSFEVYSENNSVVKGCKTDSKGTVVQGHHKTYRMSASTEEERDLWLQAIRESIKEHPFYDIITSKKAALRRKSLKHVQQHDIPTPTTPKVTNQQANSEPTGLSYSAQT